MAPTTTAKTPRSNRSAVAAGTLPIPGRSQVPEVRRQERIAEEPGAHAREGGAEQAEADPTDGTDPQPRLDPAGAARHVLKDQCDRHRDPGRKAAAGQVVPAQEEVDRDRDDHREQPLHDHRRDREIVGDRVADRAVRSSLVIGILHPLLLRCRDAFRRRPEPAQERRRP